MSRGAHFVGPPNSPADTRRGKKRPMHSPLLHSFLEIRGDPDEASHGARLVLPFDRRQTERKDHDLLHDSRVRSVLSGPPRRV